MKGVVNPSTGMTFGDMFAAPASQGGFEYSEVTAAAAMTDLTAFGFAGKIGLAWQPNENVSLGFSYGTPVTLTYKNGNAKMDMTAQMNDAFAKAMSGVLAQNPGMTMEQAQAAVMQMFGNMGIDLSLGVAANFNLQTKLTLPQTIGFGMMMTIADGLRFSADLEYVGWESAFDNMTLTMTGGDNANINRMLGNDGSLELEFPMKWEDAMTLRMGAELDLLPELTVRAGGAFGTNPVPASTLFPVFPAIVENHLMAGCSYEVMTPLTVHFAYEHAFNASRTAAATSLLAREYDGSVSQLAEDIFNIGASWILE
jgi:long-chain fatty acid transport protein